MKRKYYKTLKEARKALEERKTSESGIGIFRMSKGTRHHGEFAVCSEFEWLNTY